MRPTLLDAILAACLLLSPSNARAGNVDSFFQSDEAAMAGGAVVAITAGTGSIWYNPAGLGANDRNKLNLSATAVTFRLREVPTGMLTTLGTQEVHETLSSADFLVAPAALSMAWRLSEGLSAGFGVFVSEQDFFTLRGGETSALSLGGTVTPRGQVTTERIRYHVGPSIGAQVTDRLRVGVSAFVVFERRDQSGQFSMDITGSASSDTTAIAQFTDERQRLGGEVVAGLQWEPSHRLRIGLAIRSPRFLFRENTVYQELAAGGDGTDSAVDYALLGDRAEGNAEHLMGAGRLVLASALVFEGGEVSVEVDYSHRLIARDLNDVWNFRVGGLYKANERLHLGAGVFSDRSPVRLNDFPEARVDYYGVAMGLEFRNPVRLAERRDAPDDLVFTTTVGLRYAVGVGEATRVRFDLVETGAAPQLRIRSNDPTSVAFHEVSLHIGTGLDF